MSNPEFPTVLHDFWGTPTPHIKLSNGDANVVLEHAFKTFSAIADSGQLSRKLAACIDEVKAGTIESLDASDLTPFHPILDSGRTSAKTQHAVPQLWMKRFLLRFVPNSQAVREHANMHIELDPDLVNQVHTLEQQVVRLESDKERRDTIEGTLTDLQNRLEQAEQRLCDLRDAEIASEDDMCLAQLRILYRRAGVEWTSREAFQALYLGQYVEVREEWAGRASVSRPAVVAWLRDNPKGKRFWAQLATMAGLRAGPFDSSIYEIEHINNEAWGGADHPFNYMILPRAVNNTVEFRSGPCHLKMIMLGRTQFARVQAFAKWHASKANGLPRNDFLHTVAFPGVKILTDELIQSKLVLGKRPRV
jgi:hypothetical protein